MNNINYHTSETNEHIKGYVTLDNNSYVAELVIIESKIEIRVFDFNRNINHNTMDMFSLKTIVFHGNLRHYQLFGLALNGYSNMKIGPNNTFTDYSYSASGFLHSKSDLNDINFFTGISIYAEKLKKWTGSTRKLDAVLICGLNNTHPENEHLVEFEKHINSIGNIGLYYSYRLGGLNGLHTVGMSISPHITLKFENASDLDQLIEQYIDLYMILRFLIGDSLDISRINILSEYITSSAFGDGIELFLPEKKTKSTNKPQGTFIPYSSVYRDNTEDTFPNIIWGSYYNQNLGINKSLLKKFITYTMVDNNEEKFLGYYRILESITMKTSYYVDESDLEVLLKRARGLLSRKFPNSSMSEFIRAVKRANKNKANTESCIIKFIKSLPPALTEGINLNKLPINEICTTRNKIIHQPLFSASPEVIYRYMEITEALTKLAMLIQLEIPIEKIEEIAYYHGWQLTFNTA